MLALRLALELATTNAFQRVLEIANMIAQVATQGTTTKRFIQVLVFLHAPIVQAAAKIAVVQAARTPAKAVAEVHAMRGVKTAARGGVQINAAAVGVIAQERVILLAQVLVHTYAAVLHVNINVLKHAHLAKEVAHIFAQIHVVTPAKTRVILLVILLLIFKTKITN